MIKKSLRVPVGKFPKKASILYKGKILTLKSSPNKLKHSRVGVIVGKGVVRHANRRNKVKRIIFNVFDKNTEIINRPGNDYVVIVKDSDELDEGDLGRLTSELEASLSNIKNDN